jgi:hypothetical protein
MSNYSLLLAVASAIIIFFLILALSVYIDKRRKVCLKVCKWAKTYMLEQPFPAALPALAAYEAIVEASGFSFNRETRRAVCEVANIWIKTFPAIYNQWKESFPDRYSILNTLSKSNN